MAQLISSFGTYIFYIGALSYAQKISNGGILVTVFTLSETAPTIFLIFTGYVADKVREKIKPVILLTISRGILFLLITVLLNISFKMDIIIFICLLNFISGIANVLVQSLLSPLPKIFLDENDLDIGLSLYSAALQLGDFLGLIVGSILTISLAYISFINSLSFFFECILYFSIFTNLKKLEFNSSLKAEKVQIDIANIIKIVIKFLKKREIFILIKNFSLLNILLASIIPYLTIFFNAFPKLIPFELKFSVFLVFLNISMSFFFIIGTNFSVKLSIHIKGLTMIAFIMGFILYLSLLLENVILFVICTCLIYFVLGIINPYVAKKILKSTDEGISTVQGVFNTFLNIGSVFGSLMINVLSTVSIKLGCYFVFWIVAVYIFLCWKEYKTFK